MPIPEIAAAVSATYNIAKLTGGLLKMARTADVQAVVIDLNNSIIDVQAKIAAVQARYDELASTKEELEAKLKIYEQWEKEAARYELIQLVEGAFVYSLKAEHHNKGEPPHYLCPNCFVEKKRSILQRRAGFSSFECHACKLEIQPTPPASPLFGGFSQRRSRMIDG